MTKPIKTDEAIIERLEAIFKDPESVCQMNDDKVGSAIAFCVERLQAWDTSFSIGLAPVVKAGLETWPLTTSGADISDDKLGCLMEELSGILPADITERERMLYNLERQGKWQLFQAVSLRK